MEYPKRFIKKFDKDSESFISFVHSLPEDSVRLIFENCWFSFGESQSRITVYGFDGVLASICFPSVIAHRVMCAL